MNTKLWILLIILIAVVGTAGAQDEESYRVRYGDTLDGIAQERDISIACLAGANALTNANELSYGQMLTIPSDCDPYDLIESMIFSNVEDLTGNELLASGLGRDGGKATTSEALTTDTETKADAGGSTSMAAEADAETNPAAAAPTDEVYVVQKNDNLTKIAKNFDVSVACLQRTNTIFNPDLIYTGQELLISAGCQAEGTADLLPGAARQCMGDRNTGRYVHNGIYIVQEGDTLDFIGCDLNLSTSCLAAINNLADSGGKLEIGQPLTLSSECIDWDGLPGPGDING